MCIGEAYAPFSTTGFCGPRLDWDPRSAKDVHDVEGVLRSFLDGQNFSREAVEKLGRELSGRYEVLVTPEDTHIYTIGRELQAIIADRTSAMVLLAKFELNWYRQAINIEPPLSAICTPADVDRLAAQTIIHDFVYSCYEMPFADYIRFMAPYSADKRVRRLLHDIVRGAAERPELEDIEKLIAALERVEKVLSETHITPYFEAELSLWVRFLLFQQTSQRSNRYEMRSDSQDPDRRRMCAARISNVGKSANKLRKRFFWGRTDRSVCFEFPSSRLRCYSLDG